ncbi:EsaB/YukD family protein [Nakamurella sp. GG22]
MSRSQPTAASQPPGAPSACPVTIACGSRVRDVVLPSSIPVGELMAGLIRSLAPHHSAEPTGDWSLTRIDGTPLMTGETLDEAAVLVGDVLTLTHDPVIEERPAQTARDRIEDIVEEHGQFWDRRATMLLLLWASVVTGTLLVPFAVSTDVPALAMVGVAVLFAGLAALADHHSESVCATTLLLTAAGWAAVAGTTGLRWWTTGTAVEPVLTAMVAAGCALLLAAWTAVFRPFAVPIAAGFCMPVAGSGATVLGVIGGAPQVDSASAVAVLGALVLGALPRAVLVLTGVAGQVGTAGSAFDARLTAAQRMLTGCLVGGSAAVVLGAVPAALSGDPRSMALGFGVACLLLLRARVFAQVPHTIGPRIAGLVLLAAVATGCYRTAPSHLFIVAATIALPVTAGVLLMSQRLSAVTAARTARVLDLVERLLMVIVVVLAAANLGLLDWARALAGDSTSSQ